MKLKQMFHDQGDKPVGLLAWHIKQLQSERTVNSTEDTKVEMTADPLGINNTFKHFYESVYSLEYAINDDAQARSLNNLEFPHISEDSKGSLDARLTADEISEAINSAKAGKTARPDGLPIDIYKKFKHKLQTSAFKMSLESFQNGLLSPSFHSNS